ncbi:MAG: hypothetical protein K9N35_02830 [Candidatus Marinimicrobia bacterium]|nr:hypothetical protein [Candidatus Neomarinimicrobiota bacterium]
MKKQENLEAYLLANPQSELFAWYARQNMEAGELDRALKICRLGMQAAVSKGVLLKLIGEIYMAKGEVTQAMKYFVECILTKEPFPGVIIEVVKNMGDTMEAEQIAFLVHLLNKALPGHPDATRFYKKYPSARNLAVQPGQYKFLEDLAGSLEISSMIEVVDEEETEPQLISAEADVDDTETAQVGTAPTVDANTEIKTEPVPEAPVAPQPVKRPVTRQDPTVKHNITRSMATFTLMQIFKSQGLYENALEVLLLLREKSSNLERIDQEEKEIRELMVGNNAK